MDSGVLEIPIMVKLMHGLQHLFMLHHLCSSMSCYLVIQPVAVCLLLANGWLACRSEMHSTMKQGLGNCPVCRKVFHTKDIEHVLDLVGTSISQVVCFLCYKNFQIKCYLYIFLYLHSFLSTFDYGKPFDFNLPLD